MAVADDWFRRPNRVGCAADLRIRNLEYGEAAITAAPSSRYPGDVVLLAERVGKIRRYRAHPLGQTDQRFERGGFK